jgi:arginine:ornithine antiporter/lysine permease
LGLLFFAFIDVDLFTTNLQVEASAPEPFTQQVQNAIAITLWAFIGIESAVLIYHKAANKKIVPLATFTAFFITALIYISLSILPFAIMPKAELAALGNPSLAGVMNYALNSSVWGAFINLAFLISVSGAFISWTIINADIPFAAAENGLINKKFAALNRHGIAYNSLLITTITTQIFLILAYKYNQGYLHIVNMATLAVIIPYLLCALTAFNLCLKQKLISYYKITLCLGALVYVIFIIAAANAEYILSVTYLYLIGIILFYANKLLPN